MAEGGADGVEPSDDEKNSKDPKQQLEAMMKEMQKKAFEDAAAQNAANAQSCGSSGGGGEQGGMPMMPPSSGGGDDGGGKKDDNNSQQQPQQQQAQQPQQQQQTNVDQLVKQMTSDGDSKTKDLESEIAAQKQALDEQNRASQERLAALDRQRVEDQQKAQEQYLAALKQVQNPQQQQQDTQQASTAKKPTDTGSGTQVAERERITISDRLKRPSSSQTARGAAPEQDSYDRAITQTGAGTRAATGDDEPSEEEQLVDQRKLKKAQRGVVATKPAPTAAPNTAVVATPSELQLVSTNDLVRARNARRAATASR